MTIESFTLTARRSYASEVRGAISDFSRSFASARVWRVLAWNDILARYRGSLIGPFWITLTQGAFILGIGLLYSQLFKVTTRDYIPLLANGVIIWQLINGIVLDGCDTFIQGTQIIRQTSMPLPSFLWRVTTRNLLIFLHQAVILLIVAVWFGYVMSIQIWWAALGLVLDVGNVTWMALILAVICTRFRDMTQVITATMQVLFFLTPVLWDPKQAPRAAAVMGLNPFTHMVQVVRDPLLGRTPNFASFGILLVMMLVGWALAFAFFASVRRRIVHYL